VKNIFPPIYGGDPKEFRFFNKNFKIAVHENPEYTDPERYLCFLTLLSGKPLDGAKGFTEHNGGYQAAYAKFVSDYGNPTKLCQVYKDELSLLPDFTGDPFPHDRSNLVKVKDVINNLKATDKDFNTKTVLRKFSKDVVILAYRTIIHAHPLLDFDLMDLLKAIENNIFIEDIYKLKTSQFTESKDVLPVKNVNKFVNTAHKHKSRYYKSNSSQPKNSKRKKTQPSDPTVPSSNSKPKGFLLSLL